MHIFNDDLLILFFGLIGFSQLFLWWVIVIQGGRICRQTEFGELRSTQIRELEARIVELEDYNNFDE